MSKKSDRKDVFVSSFSSALGAAAANLIANLVSGAVLIGGVYFLHRKGVFHRSEEATRKLIARAFGAAAGLYAIYFTAENVIAPYLRITWREYEETRRAEKKTIS